ncbi:hypothetical protein D3C78_1384150 [compost metagenome]
MDIEQATLVVADETGAENAHESGQDHKFGLESVDQFDQGGIEGFTAFERLVIQGAGVDTRVPGALQTVGIGTVRDHCANADRVVRVLRIVDQGLQVTAGAGQQHHNITGLGHLNEP